MRKAVNPFLWLTVLSPALLLAAETARAESYLGVEVGNQLCDVIVSATGPLRHACVLVPRQPIIVVVTGVFRFSPTGLGDAHYRWWPSKNQVVSPCEERASGYAFVIDDLCFPPLQRDLSAHLYVYALTVGLRGYITFAINDNRYADNSGHLRVQVFALP
jgi:hypothetical protein